LFHAQPDALRLMLQQIEQATRDHVQWHESLLRSVVCQLPADPAEFDSLAHQRCRFGRWCREQAPAGLREQSTFVAIEKEHEHLHRAARGLLRQSAALERIDVGNYDEFAASSARLRAGIEVLRNEIQGALHSTDALTGAYGRAEMLPELREWRELAERGVQHCCLAFMDVDCLKRINDQHGHGVGDQVLAETVHYVTGHLRPYDKVFRYGGDEFLLLLPGADLELTRTIMHRVRDGLNRLSLASGADGEPIQVTVSIGIAMLDPDLSVEQSIDRADKALLLAKAEGRNRVMVWDPGMTTTTVLEKMMAVDD
jgi:diguanylate cyclase (GGDEF)-like protein